MTEEKVFDLKDEFNNAVILPLNLTGKEKRWPYYKEGCFVAEIPGEYSQDVVVGEVLIKALEILLEEYWECDEMKKVLEKKPYLKSLNEKAIKDKIGIYVENGDIFVSCPRVLGIENFKMALEQTLKVRVDVF